MFSLLNHVTNTPCMQYIPFSWLEMQLIYFFVQPTIGFFFNQNCEYSSLALATSFLSLTQIQTTTNVWKCTFKPSRCNRTIFSLCFLRLFFFSSRWNCCSFQKLYKLQGKITAQYCNHFSQRMRWQMKVTCVKDGCWNVCDCCEFFVSNLQKQVSEFKLCRHFECGKCFRGFYSLTTVV